MKPTVAVAISGGVDSMMAAYLMQKEGCHVRGIHFLTGFEPAGSSWTSTDPDTHPVRDIGTQLRIPMTVVDCRKEFQANVVDYFTRSYMQGLTPNPCVVCNPRIKFGVVMAYAEKMGADHLATGHYARIREEKDRLFHLYRGKDPAKDQSYFLARLPQEKLRRARFPLGATTKSEVRALARKKGFKPVAESESQDVCFVKGDAYADFIESRPGFKAAPGPIEDTRGRVIGEHPGLHRFTVGQRRGINCPAAEPYYVVRLDPAANRLIVGARSDGLTRQCRVKAVNWIATRPQLPLRACARVRYRHREAPATISAAGDDTLLVEFDSPQTAVTPGQAAVFYDNDEVLGGGFIAQV